MMLCRPLWDASVAPASLAWPTRMGRATLAVLGVGVSAGNEPARCVSRTSIPSQPYQVLGEGRTSSPRRRWVGGALAYSFTVVCVHVWYPTRFVMRSILHRAVCNKSAFFESLRLRWLAQHAFCSTGRIWACVWNLETRRPDQVSTLCLNLLLRKTVQYFVNNTGLGNRMQSLPWSLVRRHFLSPACKIYFSMPWLARLQLYCCECSMLSSVSV